MKGVLTDNLKRERKRATAALRPAGKIVGMEEVREPRRQKYLLIPGARYHACAQHRQIALALLRNRVLRFALGLFVLAECNGRFRSHRRRP